MPDKETRKILIDSIISFFSIVITYGIILDVIGTVFFKLPFSVEFIAAFGLTYYLLFYEIFPLSKRRRFFLPKEKAETTKERGRDTVETATGKKVKQ